MFLPNLIVLLAKPNGDVNFYDVDDNEEETWENEGKMIYFSPCDDKGVEMLERPGVIFEVCVCHKPHDDDDSCHKKRLVKPKRYVSYVSSFANS